MIELVQAVYSECLDFEPQLCCLQAVLPHAKVFNIPTLSLLTFFWGGGTRELHHQCLPHMKIILAIGKYSL